ncbi:hypothetical protein LTR15_006787 [Elasticomyces elasticus]|nr:hypothetical protein LTR15_006787 [Elasticomyces elasticus]
MPSPHSSDSTQDQTEMASSAGAGRPPIAKRHSSQSSHGGSSRQITSPGSAGEHHPLRHAVGARQRHKIMLPRNHSSGRNLAKMGKQVQAAQHVQYAAAADDAAKRHARQRSHEGDSEIRLPGSLDESKPLLRRNVTSHELPTRNKSSTKLKKNLSHGQLTRLASGKNLVGLGTAGMSKVAPPSPGLKARKGRAKSEEVAVVREKDLHEQEVELMLKRQQQQQERKTRNQEAGAAPRHVGFAVGSADGDEESEDMELNETSRMEGSQLQQEDEWTDNSASASPLSTRINTANNSRRPSMMAVDHKPPDEDESEQEPQHPNIRFHMTEVKQPKEQVPQTTTPEADGTPEEDDDTEEDMPSPKSMPAAPLIAHEMPPQESLTAQSSALASPPAPTQPPPPHIRSPLHAAKDYPHSVAKRLTSAQLPAPALVSNVTALDDIHSTRGSPAPSIAPSLRSTRSISGHGHDGAADQEDEQFISKFLPSSSHPSTGSGTNTTAMNTPKIGSFQAPKTLEEGDRTLDRAVKSSNTNGGGPTSPEGSTRSASSGATTPSFGVTGKSRFEMQMLKDKALADREAAAELKPDFPHHKYDRRNESLKSYLNLIALGEKQRGLQVSTVTVPLGPEIFQGRFKAVNVELKVVQQYRDPIAESVRRLRGCEGGKLGRRTSPQKKKDGSGALKSSKSAVTLPSRIKPAMQPSKLSTSASPPRMGGQHTPQKAAPGAAPMAKSAILVHTAKGEQQRRRPRRGVSFAGAELTETREYEREEEEEVGPDGIARMLWDGVGV